MPVLSAQQVASWWKSEGGPDKSAVAWVSVSLAESSWDTEAVSPTGAVGLYQVEPYSWPAQLGSFSMATDPGYNTLAAIDLSGGGVNFAPWDTAYANIYASGRYSFLAWPEPGSAAFNHMVYVATVLGTNPDGNAGPPPQPGISGTLPDALKWFSDVTYGAAPALSARARAVSARAGIQYRGR